MRAQLSKKIKAEEHQHILSDHNNNNNNTYTHIYTNIVQELWESRGGRPGLSVLTSLLVSVDVKIY